MNRGVLQLVGTKKNQTAAACHSETMVYNQPLSFYPFHDVLGCSLIKAYWACSLIKVSLDTKHAHIEGNYNVATTYSN